MNTIFLFSVLLIVSYQNILNTTENSTKNDILSKKFVNLKFFGDECCSGWSLSHLILYFIVTYKYPSQWLKIFIIGCLWELLEYFLGTFYTEKTVVNENGDSLQYEEKWWTGNKSDILFNSIGILLALMVVAYLQVRF